MPKDPKQFILNSKKHLSAISSAVRQEILDVLSQMGAVSVAELAQTLGRPADALYYHLKILAQAGIVLTAGHRMVDGKKEALFSAAGEDVRIDYAAARKLGEKPLAEIAGSILRLSNRDFRRALRDDEIETGGPGRELWAARKTAWLTQEELAMVNEKIGQLLTQFSRPKRVGNLYGITVLLTPVNRKRSKQKVRRKSVKSKEEQ